MRFGIRGHDLGCHTPQDLVQRYTTHGVEAVQLAVPKAVEGVQSYADVGDSLLAELDTLLRRADITVPVLGCYIDPALEDEAALTAQLAEFMAGIRAAAALRAGCVGTETTVFSGNEGLRPAAFDRLCRSLESMLAEAQRFGVTVAVEPVTWHTLNTPSLTDALLRRFFGSSLAIIFDPVNLLTPENIDMQQSLWRECLEVFGQSIMALHVKDARLQDGRLVPCPFGEGVMDFSPVIAPWLREHKPDIALLREETSPATVESDLAWMRDTFQQR